MKAIKTCVGTSSTPARVVWILIEGTTLAKAKRAGVAFMRSFLVKPRKRSKRCPCKEIES